MGSPLHPETNQSCSQYGDRHHIKTTNFGQIVHFVHDITKRTKAMQIVSATEAKRSSGAVIDKAQREPAIIRKQNRDLAVVLSIEDYQRITSNNIQEF
jgi:prevent-host-death family protein